jgi:DnaJ-domain-containing protein 1
LNDERREERDKIRDKYKGQELDARLQQLNVNIEARKQEIKERIAELNES